MVYASKDPVWEEGFTFFVHNIKDQQLSVQVEHLKSSLQEDATQFFTKQMHAFTPLITKALYRGEQKNIDNFYNL